MITNVLLGQGGDALLNEAGAILGSKEIETTLKLIPILFSNPFTSFLVPDVRKEALILKRQLVEIDPTLLVSDQTGAAAVLPTDLPISYWPMKMQAVVSYTKGQEVAVIEACGEVWRVPCRYVDDRFYLSWPKALGIRGALNIKSNASFIVTIPLRYKYPASLVVDSIKQNESCYRLLEKTGLTGDFFVADTPQDALAIFLLAIYNYSQSLNQ